MSSFRIALLSAVAIAGSTVPSLAEDWVATKLRGLTFVHNNGQWQPLQRGDTVTELDVVRTLPSGRAEFSRGSETISLAGDTQIRVVDARNAKFTTVHQAYGKVTVDVDRENVQHFAVQTQFLAAVVKGTVFTVEVRGGQARVSVDEGRVRVQDTVHQVAVDVLPGQQAQASDRQLLSVSGRGTKEAIVDASGAPLPPSELAALRKEAKETGRGAETGAAGNGNRGGKNAANGGGKWDSEGPGQSGNRGNSGGNGGNSGQGGGGGQGGENKGGSEGGGGGGKGKGKG